MRLSVRAMATACSLLWGGALLLVATCNAIWPAYGGNFMDCMSSVYPGFQETGTLAGILMDLLYGLVDGAIAGALLAWLYNSGMGKGWERALSAHHACMTGKGC